MRFSERIYRFLLKGYPRSYREWYQEPMAQLFSDQLRDANTVARFTALWLRTLTDLVRTLPARHAETPASHYGLKDALRVPFVPWDSSARRSVFLACCEANAFGRSAVTTEDLLLGILREDREIQRRIGTVAEAIRREIETRETRIRQVRAAEDLPLDAACRSAVALAKEEAPRWGSTEATTHHLLTGILRQEQTFAAQLLRRYGVDPEQLRRGE